MPQSLVVLAWLPAVTGKPGLVPRAGAADVAKVGAVAQSDAWLLVGGVGHDHHLAIGAFPPGFRWDVTSFM